MPYESILHAISTLGMFAIGGWFLVYGIRVRREEPKWMDPLPFSTLAFVVAACFIAAGGIMTYTWIHALMYGYVR